MFSRFEFLMLFSLLFAEKGNARTFPRPYIVKKTAFTIRLSIKNFVSNDFLQNQLEFFSTYVGSLAEFLWNCMEPLASYLASKIPCPKWQIPKKV